MPKITPPSPVVFGNLLTVTPLVLNPRRAPVDHVVVTPPAGPVQNGPIANPSTPPSGPPPGISQAELARWVRDRLLEQEALRSASFWDTGYLLGLLMPAKALLGVKDLKELIAKYDLPLSHFTALKYMTVARDFDRETAKSTGVEKCYALTLYAKVIGRVGKAAEILARNERIVGAEPAALARTVSASQLMRIVRSKKAEARGEKVPTAVQQEREKIGKDTRKIIRDLGFKRASASIVRRDGRPMVAIYLPLEDAQKWDPTKVIPMIANAAKKDAAVRQLLTAKVPGLTLKRSA